MERHVYLDQFKAFAIFLVVLGHNDYSSFFVPFFNSFSLAIFFVVSGMVSSPSSDGFFVFVKKKAFRLLVPYFFWAISLYLFWYVIGRKFGDNEYSLLKNFIGIFYAQGGADYMNWGIPMWFLPALFVVSVLNFLILRFSLWLRCLMVVAFIAAGYWFFKHWGFHLPWSFDVALVMSGFYFFGILLRDYKLLDAWGGSPFFIFFLSLCLHLVLYKMNLNVHIYYGEYGNVVLMYLNGLLGVMWGLLLFKRLPDVSIVSYIGRNTLPILAFHLLAMAVIKAVAVYVIGIQLNFGFIYCVLYSFLQIIMLTPLIMIINRYLPFMVGSGLRKRSLNNPAMEK